jgi:hypothetical protein
MRNDSEHVVLVWKSIVNWRYMETEMVVSAARLFSRSTSAHSGSFPRIALCHDLRALPEQCLKSLHFLSLKRVQITFDI